MSVVLHLHPDLPFAGGLVIESLARDGVYRSQFATGTSNGGLTAVPGGDRWRWESRLFDGRYDDAPPADRPVYGAWLRRSDPYGAAPRFGSSYLRLVDACAERATYCFPDSVLEPTDVGGPELLDHLCSLADTAAGGPGADPLDDYVEAHVHGVVRVPQDVVEVVLDPCFADGPVHEAARAVGPVSFHPGYRLDTAVLDDGYRGPAPAALARALGAVLTPADVGAAARSGQHDPQTLKRVWHLLARFGRAGPRAGRRPG